MLSTSLYGQMLSIFIIRSNVKHNHYKVNVKHVFIWSNINHGPKLSKPYYSGKPIQKPKESTKASKTSSQKSPNKIQSDRRPKGSDDEIQKFNRFQCLDEDMEADTDYAEQTTNKQGRIIKLSNR